jgi:hypothetical protein
MKSLPLYVNIYLTNVGKLPNIVQEHLKEFYISLSPIKQSLSPHHYVSSGCGWWRKPPKMDGSCK